MCCRNNCNLNVPKASNSCISNFEWYVVHNNIYIRVFTHTSYIHPMNV